MPKLTIAGQQIDPKEEKYASLQEHFDLRVEPRTAVRVGVSRGDNATVELADLHDDDLVELTYSNGLHQWTTVDKLRQRYAETQPTQRAAGKTGESDASIIGARLPESESERGAVDTVLDTLELLGFDLPDAVATLGVKGIIAYFESKLTPGPGLYRITQEGKLGDSVTGELSHSDKPYLLLIHGTFSSTPGTYDSLFSSREWSQLWNYYDGRILGFNHRSLSQSPIHNALDLIQQLPQGAKLHIISHSRGGLVGELLCMDSFADDYLDAFDKKVRKADIDNLRALTRQLQEKQINVSRFVRVACPARGTILTSERFDEYLSGILNLLGYVPALKDSQIYDFAKATILTLVKKRANPEDVPGLEAMIPGSPLVRMLNHPNHKSNSDLAVVAGDLEAGGNLWKMLRTWASDLFYWEDHDLVVHTKSMYGGLERPQNAVYFLRRASDMTHFNYFVSDDSRSQVYRWLTQTAGKQPEDFHSLALVRTVERSANRSKLADDAPIVILIPGLFASHLRVKDQPIWLNRESLATGQLALLAKGKAGVQPAGIVNDNFAALIDRLADSFDVHVHAYDWRNSLKDEAALLAARVEEALQSGRKLQLLAHSSGGLLARALMTYHPAIWEKLCKAEGRLLMLGTPNHGSYAVLELLSGQAELIRMLSLLDGKMDVAAICQQFRNYPGILELLPHGQDDWHQLFLNTIQDEEKEEVKKLLDGAAAVHKEMEAAIDSDHMLAVEGKAASTISGLQKAEDTKNSKAKEAASKKLVFLDSPLGDGFVTAELGRLADVPSWSMDAVHGELTTKAQHFDALIELLLTGNTWRLPRATELKATGEALKTHRSRMVLYPTKQELIAAALSTNTPKPFITSSEPTATLQISVLHAGLEHSSYPLAIGHYEGDTIVGAEAVLDSKLDHRLSQRRYMNLYPGKEGTVEVILNPLGEYRGQAKGALVIGLGEVGKVTPEIVANGVCEAALRMALAKLDIALLNEENADRLGNPRIETRISAAFSALLIGTRSGKTLSIESSVAAVVTGAIAANRMLRERKLLDSVCIDAIEFVEIYSEYAIRAAHAVANIKQYLRTTLSSYEAIQPSPFLREGEGGYTGQPLHDYDAGWWQPLQIKAVDETDDKCKAGNLQFLRLTDRARAELTLQSTQQALVEKLVEKSIRESGYSLDLSATLYELLLPNQLKELSLESGNLLLILDEKTTQFPWEMMTERRYGSLQPSGDLLEPLAVRMGLIRQLERERFRMDVQPTHSNNVLVIGDPRLDAAGYPPLPGARAEAEAVASVLSDPKHGFTVTTLIQADAIAIVNALFAKDYRIIHIAGHGIYQPECPTRSGIVLGENIFLTAAEFGQLRVVPEMVFLNCCHGGRIDSSNTSMKPGQPAWHRLAASVSQQLIEIGVRAIVAAGWAVNDRSARKFAEALYNRMLGDTAQQFGDAVRNARYEIYRSDRSNNTWGAYQCYGDPGFMLKMVASAAPPSNRNFVAVEEIRRQLKNFQARARQTNATNSATRNEIRKGVANLENRVRSEMPGKWYDGELLCMFGDTYAELLEFREAILRYREAIGASGASQRVPIQAIEQLANLSARYAWLLYVKQMYVKQKSMADKDSSASKSNPKTETLDGEWSVNNLLDKAQEHLERLLEMQRNAHRLALLASCCKRRAMIKDGETEKEAKEKALLDSVEAYEEAYDVSKDSDIPYAALNWITCQVFAGIVEKNRAKLEEAFGKCEAKETNAPRIDFWSRITPGDIELVRLLYKKYDAPLEEQRELVAKIRQSYQSAFAIGGTLREHSTIIENLEFVVAMLRWRDKAELAELLQTVIDGLRPRQDE